MLSKIEDTLVSKMIGLFNGLETEIDDDIISYLNEWLKALKEHKVEEKHLLQIINLKKKYLPNCLTCQNPCGRTADFSINSISNVALRDKRINDYLHFIKEYNSSMSINDVVYNIVKLGW